VEEKAFRCFDRDVLGENKAQNIYQNRLTKKQYVLVWVYTSHMTLGRTSD